MTREPTHCLGLPIRHRLQQKTRHLREECAALGTPLPARCSQRPPPYLEFEMQSAINPPYLAVKPSALAGAAPAASDTTVATRPAKRWLFAPADRSVRQRARPLFRPTCPA